MVDDEDAPGRDELPLAGVLVVDLSEGIAGPFCTKLLGGFGARVIKIERPGGDPTRRRGPFPGDEANPEASGLFLHLNTDKDGIVVDLERPEGTAVVRELVARAHVVVESSKPGAFAGSGLDPSELLDTWPQLVVCSITPFGQTGPYRDYEMTDIVGFAMGGPMSANGNPEREPVKLVGNMVEVQAGNTACAIALGALFHAENTGEGQHVDVAVFETQNGSTDRRREHHMAHQYSGTVVERSTAVFGALEAPGGRFRAADGVFVTPGEKVWFGHADRMVATLGDETLRKILADQGSAGVCDAHELVNPIIAAWAAARTGREAMREAQRNGWPLVVVNDPQSLLSDEHFTARGYWQSLAHPVAGDLPYCGPAIRLDGGGWELRRAAPTLGQHTEGVLRELAGYDGDRIAELRAAGVVA